MRHMEEIEQPFGIEVCGVQKQMGLSMETRSRLHRKNIVIIR